MGGFTCKCSQGYALDESGIRCVGTKIVLYEEFLFIYLFIFHLRTNCCVRSDIDECSIMHGVCGDGECQNIPGSFVCKCKEGYETSQLMQVCMGTYILLFRFLLLRPKTLVRGEPYR